MVGTLVHQLTKGVSPEVLKREGLGEYYTDHEKAMIITALKMKEIYDDQNLSNTQSISSILSDKVNHPESLSFFHDSTTSCLGTTGS